MLSVLFLIKPSEKNNKGQCPIYCRITINGTRKEIATGIRVPEDWWNVEAKKVVPPRGSNNNDKAMAREFNETIRIFEGRVRSTYNKLSDNDINVTALRIKNELQGTSKSKTVLDALAVLKKKAIIAGSKSVPEKIDRFAKHFGDFTKKVYRTETLSFDDLKDKRSISIDFQSWATSEKGWKSTYIRKEFNYLTQSISIAHEMGWIDAPIKVASTLIKKEDMARKDVLDKSEVELLAQAELSTESLTRVRDIFLFQCYTGLSYIDVRNLRFDDLKKDKGGNLCIPKPRQKSGQEFIIPLIPAAVALIEKYRGDKHRQAYYPDNVFPVKSNGKTNQYLKVLADLCGIDKTLSTHVARYTCNQLLYEAGVSDEIRKQILGHSTVKMTAHYTRVNSEVLAGAMEKIGF